MPWRPSPFQSWVGLVCADSKNWFYLHPTTEMQNEPFSQVLMDKELEFSGWNLLSPKEECFEFCGQTGRAGFG